MKDKHNVILILVSSSVFNSLFRRLIKFLISIVSSFFSGVPSSLNYLVAQLHLNHCKDSPCVFNSCFFLSSFYYWSSSRRLNMMVHQGFNSFSKCSSRFFSEEFKHSSSCIPKCNSFISHLLRWSNVIVDNFPFVFHDTHVFKSDISKSIILIYAQDFFSTIQYLLWSYLGLYFT